MNIITHNFGKVKVMIDSNNDRYVTIDRTTKRFGLYAMAEVDKLFDIHNSAEKAYTEVFEKLERDSDV